MYAKTTQKTKKCLRCGCSHKVSTVINSGVIVKRMTEAVNMVKYKQNEIALNELSTKPNLRQGMNFR